jgi:hypothetical protein
MTEVTVGGHTFVPQADCNGCRGTGVYAEDDNGTPTEPCVFCLEDAGIVEITWPGGPPGDRTLDPARHCFREDSPTNRCRDCGYAAEAHTGCDCE